MGGSRLLRRKTIVCFAPKRGISVWTRPPPAQLIQRAAQERRPTMWRKTVWLIATLTLSIFVASVATREGWAQNPGKVYRVGVVVVLPPDLLPPNAPRPSFPGGPLGRAFLDRLADHGYIEGKNLVIEARFGGYERLAELAVELVRLQVDVIFTGGTKAARIVSDVVKETPLV